MVDETILNYEECEILAKMIAVKNKKNLNRTRLAEEIGYEAWHPYFGRVYKFCLDNFLIEIIEIVGSNKIILLNNKQMRNFLWNQPEFQKRVDLYRNAGMVLEKW